jgi:hypothetical protein
LAGSSIGYEIGPFETSLEVTLNVFCGVSLEANETFSYLDRTFLGNEIYPSGRVSYNCRESASSESIASSVIYHGIGNFLETFFWGSNLFSCLSIGSFEETCSFYAHATSKKNYNKKLPGLFEALTSW